MHNYSGKFREGDVCHSGDMVEVMCTGTGAVRNSPGTTGKMSPGDRSRVLSAKLSFVGDAVTCFAGWR